MKKAFISDILKALMFKKNIRATQLAREINVPQQTLQRIVSGNSPRPHVTSLKPIADYFNISIEQLKGDIPLPDELVEIDNVPVQKPVTNQIPLIKWDEFNQDFDLAQYHPSEYILVDGKLSKANFSVQMQDASMSPYFPEKSILIFSKDKEVKDRSYVLVALGDSNTAVFRQILFDGTHRYLKPLNPDLNMFKMQLSKENDKILGVLVECRHSYLDM
jgi:SOS-response transcriptional repressor LexA